VFDQAKRGREFFEETIRENLDLGRPDRVQMVFGRKITKATPGRFRTRVINTDVSPSLHIEYNTTAQDRYISLVCFYGEPYRPHSFSFDSIEQFSILSHYQEFSWAAQLS
jgi:hypothetical protein